MKKRAKNTGKRKTKKFFLSSKALLKGDRKSKQNFDKLTEQQFLEDSLIELAK
jgi:hypothetical protein